jgi:hypothetical protein
LIGKLKINLSWTNFNKQPAILILEDLFVLLGPFEEKINDPKRIEELLAAHKKKQLQEIDKIDQSQLYGKFSRFLMTTKSNLTKISP